MCISIVASAFQYGCAPTLMPSDDHVDLAARLGELDDAPQDARDPVHVLGAAVHGDLAPPDDGVTIRAGTRMLLGEVERGNDPAALRFGERTEAAARIAEQDHPGHALRVRGREIADHAGDEIRGVATDSPINRDEGAIGIEVVLDEVTRWEIT